MSKKTFRRNLQKLREERRWTQEDLARASGISRRTISRYEWKGVRPRPVNLVKLAEALGCTVDVLLTGRESSDRGRVERRARARKLVLDLEGANG